MEDSEIVISRPAAGTAVVTVTGDHDAFSVPLLHHALETASQRAACVVVDLTQATFVDSHLLSGLASARSTHPEVSIVLVVEPGSQVDSVLRMVRYDRLFRVYDSIAQALRACDGLASVP